MAQQNELELLRMLEEVISAEKKDAARILEHFHECRSLGIEIMPLDINQSEMACVFEREQVLRLGFSAFGSGNGQFFEDLLNERRENGPYQSFQDMCERVEIDRLPETFFPNSIKAGVYDRFGDSRAKLLEGFSRIVQAVQKEQADTHANQISLFELLPAASRELIQLPDADAWTHEVCIEYEKEVLGFSFTEYVLEFEDGAQENAEDVECNAEKARSVEDKLCIRLCLPIETTTKLRLLALRDLCQQYGGPHSLFLEFIDANGKTVRIQTHHKYAVRDADEFRQEIQALFENATVLLESLPDEYESSTPELLRGEA
ncbi:hypothetical protein CSB45_09275 [candidate division KSB3 bacterium]|uniref:DNA polymerase helix-hairpin-helix motif domain-containing protein n=1 Tax=candidate division KSB3 bacterium TaxID=2044937 RepID=A0A2G6E452_9BACT|nr:MAG: hypothetical protein CSB45_09275 [candidate division KSB3 bacterium]PIE29481.1 MAG: hypothetical protein CSA57_08800 [candidate division KSB3 bacterium]